MAMLPPSCKRSDQQRLRSNLGARVIVCSLSPLQSPRMAKATPFNAVMQYSLRAEPSRVDAGGSQDRAAHKPLLMRRSDSFRPMRGKTDKFNKIKYLTVPHAILTWQEAVSMVRAALKGDGAQFPATCGDVSVFTSWRKARTRAAETEVAINRPMRLRFPQGSEVLINGCPNFVTTARSGLTNLEVEAKMERPEHLRWRVVFGFPPS
jgi:hypothetical protein